MLYVTCCIYTILYARQVQSLISGAKSRWGRFLTMLISNVEVAYAVCDLPLLYYSVRKTSTKVDVQS